MLVDFENCDQASEQIASLMSLSQEEYNKIMGDNAKRVAEEYSWDLVARKVTAVYKDVLGKEACLR